MLLSRPQPAGPPRITSVRDHAEGHTDRLTPGGMFTITGHGLGTFREVPDEVGVFVSCASGFVIERVARYVEWRDDEIRGYWPTGVGGPFWLFVETQHEGLVHSVVHFRLISQGRLAVGRG
jgi:hypothetical protein